MKKKEVEVQIRVPKDAAVTLETIAKLAGVPVEHVILVALAREALMVRCQK